MEVHGEVTNIVSTDLDQPSEVAIAGVMAARADLDQALQTDPGKLSPEAFATARKLVVERTARLSKTIWDFQEKFPTNYPVQVAQQETFSRVLGGMLEIQKAAFLGNLAERLPSCSFAAEVCEQAHISREEASQMQSAVEMAFADAVIAALKFQPESYNGVYMFMKRANPNAANKLARAVVNDPATDDSLKESARSVLKRKFTIGTPLTLKFTALDGRQVDLEKLRGKVVLVDFWATGCAPCMAKLPALEMLYQKYHDRGFEVVGISTDTDKKDVLRVIQEKAIPWPIDMDINGRSNKVVMECGVNGIPDYWLIDKNGIIREFMADSNLEKKIEFLLTDDAASAR